MKEVKTWSSKIGVDSTAPCVSLQVKNDPTFSNVSVKQFDVMEEHPPITRSPVLFGQESKSKPVMNVQGA